MRKPISGFGQDTGALAAQYVRMSTEHQQYSIDNQRDAIAEYAAAHGLTVSRTYADPGRSGLTLKGRPGLQQLLSDVASGDFPYRTLLVYDVSRWGRFQDSDEAAAYEFLVRSHGVRVVYCIESFDSEGGPMDALLKQMKRSMAAQYSYDLSLRLSRGKRKVASLGYWAGKAPYGLERWAKSEDGREYRLREGERKASQDFRTVLKPGPPDAVENIRRAYALFLGQGLGVTATARALNGEGRRCRGGSWFQPDDVRRLFTNEVYCGDLVFNRTRSFLGSRVAKRPQSEWIVVHDAFPAIVTRGMQKRARRRLNARAWHKSDEELVEALKAARAKYGHLDWRLLNSKFGLPCQAHLRKRFGSVALAFALAGQPSALTANVLAKRRVSLATRTGQCGQLRLTLQARGFLTEAAGPRMFELGRQRVVVCASRPSSHGDCVVWRSVKPAGDWDLIVICKMPDEGDLPTQFYVAERCDVRSARNIYLPKRKYTAFQPGPPLTTLEEATDRLIELACL